MRRIIFVVLVAASILAGCVTAYEKKTTAGGYSETQLGENIFQVLFVGNSYDSHERVSDFSLLRSAEITVEKGYRYFIIVESDRYSEVHSYTTPLKTRTTEKKDDRGGSKITTSTYGGDTYVVSKPRSGNKIICYKEKPDNEGLVFDAGFIIKSIRTKYEMK